MWYSFCIDLQGREQLVMMNDSGYFHTEERGVADTQYELSVNSAGRYNLITRQSFETSRPLGRMDFQLLYVAKGKAYFQIAQKPNHVTEGHMVLYYPGDCQYYRYELQDRPDVYWIHFTGSQADTILAEMGFRKSGVYRTGPQSEFVLLIQKIIQELQLKRSHYKRITNLYIKEFIELFARYSFEEGTGKWGRNEYIERAIIDFHQSGNQPIRINDYARRLNISSGWFIRCFKQYTGKTPQHYMIEIRINKAKELLYSSSLTCNEIAQSIGYSDPLYFSRVFKQTVGVSPQTYRRSIRGSQLY